MKFNFPLNNFTSGVWSPKMQARLDTEEYMRSCEEMINMIPQVHGGAQFRGGTIHLDISNPANSAFDQDDLDTAYAASVSGNKPMRIIPYYNVNPAFRGFIICYGTGDNWKFVSQSGGTASINYGSFTGATNFADYQYMQHKQIGNFLVFTDPTSAKPPVLFINNGTPLVCPWNSLSIVSGRPNWKSIPWGAIRLYPELPIFVVPGSRTNNVGESFTLSSTDSSLVTGYPYFSASMVGMYIRLCIPGDVEGIVQITGYTNTSTVTVITRAPLPNGTGVFSYGFQSSSFWQQSVWGGPFGWPKAIELHQGRVMFGGTTLQPDTIWGSRISDMFWFEEVPSPETTGIAGFADAAYTASNARAFEATPNTAQAAIIQTMSSGKVLCVHTERHEIVISGQNNAAIGPLNINFTTSTAYGAIPVSPVRVNNYVTFVQKTGNKVRDLVFSFNEDQYKSTDLTFVAEHLLYSDYTLSSFGTIDSIKEIHSLDSLAGSSLLYAVTYSGRLLALTLDRDYKVNAWCEIQLGGEAELSPLPFKGKVISACSFSGGPFLPTYLVALVVREVDGETRCFIEIFANAWEVQNPTITGGLNLLPTYLDCARNGIAATTAPTATWYTCQASYENVFSGQEVSVIADGNYIGEYTVGTDSRGTIVFDKEYRYIIIGYLYKGRIKTSGLEAGGQIGPSLGRIKRIDEMVIRFHKTLGCYYGPDDDNLQQLPLESSVNGQVQFFSGDRVVNFPQSYNRRSQVIIEQRRPYPMYIVSVTPRGMTYEG